jgi:hypothetical protein
VGAVDVLSHSDWSAHAAAHWAALKAANQATDGATNEAAHTAAHTAAHAATYGTANGKTNGAADEGADWATHLFAVGYPHGGAVKNAFKPANTGAFCPTDGATHEAAHTATFR